MNTLTFENTTFDISTINNQIWLRATQIGEALGYSNPVDSIKNLYERNSDEFTATMTQLIELDTAGGKQQVRVFSLRGAHLLGMFARTEKAKTMRVWVLDILDKETGRTEFSLTHQQAPIKCPKNRKDLSFVRASPDGIGLDNFNPPAPIGSWHVEFMRGQVATNELWAAAHSKAPKVNDVAAEGLKYALGKIYTPSLDAMGYTHGFVDMLSQYAIIGMKTSEQPLTTKYI
jgi:prophage antirepressor-like protein